MTHVRRARRQTHRGRRSSRRWPSRQWPSRQWPSRRWPSQDWLGQLVGWLAFAVVLASAACSSVVGQVRLPPKAAPAATPAATVSRSPTPRQLVLVAFAGYTAALHAADLSGNAAQARQLLRPYLAAARIPGVVQTERAIWARDERFFGQDVLHVLSVRVDGRHAFVHDCDNTSAMGLEGATTGLPVPGSAGIPHDNVVTRLDLVHGHWLVEFQLIEDVPCAA
jgi:hypothetical protein